MENTTPTTTASEQKDGKTWLRFGLAWLISLVFLFIVVYAISRAWKKGQQTTA